MGRRYLTAFIILIITAFASLKASAAVLHEETIKQDLKKQIIEYYKDIPDIEIEPTVLTLPFGSVSVPDGKVSYKISTASNKLTPRELIQVYLYVNGKLQKVFNAPTAIKIYKNVIVATTSIGREKPINSSVATVEKREVSNIYEYLLAPDALDKEFYAKKLFNKGDIIDERFVKAKPEVLRNSQVIVFFNSNNLTISVDGIALADGVKGEKITVLNKTYNKIYKGTVIGENKVLVKI